VSFTWDTDTPVFTERVLVILAEKNLNIFFVLALVCFQFSLFLCHDTKWFWVFQLRCVINRKEENGFVTKNRFPGLSGPECYPLKIVNFTGIVYFTSFYLCIYLNMCLCMYGDLIYKKHKNIGMFF